jgi:hypothetical protein
MQELEHYRRLRRFVVAVVAIGIAVSVTLNVMHAPSNIGAKLVGGFPPIAVFLCIELISRIPATSKALAVGRILGSLVVAGIGGAVSYTQQMDFVRHLGFSGWHAVLFPACIDGVMMVATLSLVEVARKIRTLEAEAATVASPTRARVLNDQLEDQRTLAYRTAAAQLRRDSLVSGLNGKPTNLATSVASN